MMFAGRAGNNFTVYWHLCLTVACSCVIKSLKVGYTYLIFVTDAPTVSVEKKSVMWRNFKFLYMTDEEKSKISPHVD